MTSHILTLQYAAASLRRLSFCLILMIAFPFLYLACWMSALLYNITNSRAFSHFVMRVSSNLILWLAKITLRARINSIGVPAPGSVIICNHQSALDALLLVSNNPSTVFLFRDSLSHSALFRALGMIPVGVQSKNWLEKSVAVNPNESICVFPEGRRLAPREYTKYHAGFSVIAKHTQREIQIAIIIYSKESWGKRLLPNAHIGHRTITLYWGQLYPADTPREEIEIQMRKKQAELHMLHGIV